MKKYKVKVTTVDEYIIEFDDEIYNEQFIEAFKHFFCDFDDLSEHAEHIAKHKTRFTDDFIEGYGTIITNGHNPFPYDKAIAKGLNIRVLVDKDIDAEVEEMY